MEHHLLVMRQAASAAAIRLGTVLMAYVVVVALALEMPRQSAMAAMAVPMAQAAAGVVTT